MTPETRWFARRRDPDMAQRTEDAFRTWLATQPENGVRYAQCELVWERSAELAQDEQIREWLRELDAHLGPGNGHALSRPRRTAWYRAAAAMLLLGAATTAVFLLNGRAPVYETSAGEQRDVRLPDGSHVTLNTATRLIVRYGREARSVELSSGEALFDVRHDPHRPFEVIAGDAVARALGTKFAVERRGRAVTVSVLEGRVELLRENNRLLPPLAGGEAAMIEEPGAVATARPANVRRIEAWRERKLDFESTPLTQAIAEVNRYTTRPLVLARPELADVRISGVFHIGELEGFAFALQHTMGLRVEADGEQLLVLPAGGE